MTLDGKIAIDRTRAELYDRARAAGISAPLNRITVLGFDCGGMFAFSYLLWEDGDLKRARVRRGMIPKECSEWEVWTFESAQETVVRQVLASTCNAPCDHPECRLPITMQGGDWPVYCFFEPVLNIGKTGKSVSKLRTLQTCGLLAVSSVWPQAVHFPISVKTVRKYVVGSGSAKKEEVQPLMCELTGADLSSHEADALALAIAGSVEALELDPYVVMEKVAERWQH